MFFNLFFFFFFFKTQKNGDDPNGEIYIRKNDLITEISQAIDELSNMKTLHQLQQENLRVQETSKDLELRAKKQEERLEQAKLRLQKIEEDEREKCKKTTAILKDFQKKSGNGPFFESLLDILLNFQGF